MTPQSILTFLLTLTIGCTFGQVGNSDTSSTSCECSNNTFLSYAEKPIAESLLDGNKICFCGYMGEATKYRRDYGFLRPDSAFLLCGFDLIHCSTGQSIFSEGEYYTDSVKLSTDGFELYRLTNLPNPSGGTYISVPVIQFKFTRKGKSFRTDRSLAIPKAYYSDSYLKQIEENLIALKADPSMTMEAKDLELSFLFLKAVSNEKYRDDFLNSGPYDGYMGPAFNDYVSYLKLQ